MAVKTSDLIIYLDKLETLDRNLTYSSSYQNAIFFTKSDGSALSIDEAITSVNISGNDLEITTNTTQNRKIIISDYFAQNGKNSFKYIKTKEEDGIKLIDIINSGFITNPYEITTPQKGSTITGTVFNDNITGTSSNDIINAGSGNDTIHASKGNDVITGGIGLNTVVYDKNIDNFGTDTIKLTNGENLIIDLSSYGFTQISDLKGIIGFNKSNLEITLENGKIDLYGFVTKNTAGTSGSVFTYLGNDIYANLNSDDIFLFNKSSDFTSKGVFTGTRFAETIIANNLGIGTTISGGAGYNNITVTDNQASADKITGGNEGNNININKNGNKTITTGSFDDIINITGNNGVFTVKAGNGENTIEINANNGYAKTNITSGKDNDKITVRNNNADSQTVINAGAGDNKVYIYDCIGKSTVTTGSGIDIIEATGQGSAIINSGSGADKIKGGTGNDTINAGKDNDEITGGKGNDTLTGGKGSDTFIFYQGDGNDIITDATGDDTINIYAKKDAISFYKDGNNLLIKYSDNDYINVKNYFSTKNKIYDLYLLNSDEVLEKYIPTLAGLIEEKKYTITGKGSIKGTNIGEKIQGSDFNDTINALAGDDEIKAGAGNDKINAGDGDDTIYCDAGNDTITGGKGTNTIIYNATGFGDDIVNLTKGENLIIDFSDLNLSANDFEYKFTGKGNKDLLITTSHGSVTIVNFAKTDVTNNATKTTYDTSSVSLKLSAAETIDLRTKLYEINNVTANYTGNWHNESVDASNAPAAKNGKTGIVINTGLGNDTVKGSKYNDTITTGLGNNTIIYEASIFGDDIINLTKGENLTLDFSATGLTINNYKFAGSSNKDLLIETNYGTVTLVNFAKTDVTNNATKTNDDTSSVSLKLSETETIDLRTKIYEFNNVTTNYTGNWHNESVDASDAPVAKDGKTGIVINTGLGDDTVTSSKYNDTITTGLGNNTIIFKDTFGTDTIKPTKGENLLIDISAYSEYTTLDQLKSISKLGSKNLEIVIPNGGTIIIPNYATSDVIGKGTISVKLAGNNIFSLSSEVMVRSADERDFVKGVYNGTKFDENIDATFVGRNTTIKAGDGYNRIIGTDGYNDTITGGKDGNEITAGNGNKNIRTGIGNDTIVITGDGTHTIDASAGENIVNINGTGKTTVSSGSDKDIINISNNENTTTINAGKGNNEITIENSKGNNTVTTGSGNDTINISTAETNLETTKLTISVTSGSGDDTIDISGIYKSSLIKAGDGKDNIYGGDGDDTIYGGKGDDIINGGSGNNYYYFYDGDGHDIIVGTGKEIKDALIFPEATTFGAKYVGDKLILYYGSKLDNSITMENNSNVFHIKVGNTDKLEFSDYIRTLNLGEGMTKMIRGGSSRIVVCKNEMTGESLSYDIKNMDDSEIEQLIACYYLANGRLVIEGNNLKITANNGQADDIILLGNNNYLNTGDGNDFVRIGTVVDFISLTKLSSNNTVITGTGNDHVTVYGLDNTISLGSGTDSVYSVTPLSNNEITGNESKVTYIFQNNISNSIDSKPGMFAQGTTGGDCRVLALIDSLGKSSAVKNLSEFVNIEDKGNSTYEVKFKNYKESGKQNKVTITKNEIDNFGNVYGDLDTVLIDIAMDKLISINRDYERGSVQYAYYNTIGNYLFGENKITSIDDSNLNALIPTANTMKDALKILFEQYQNGDINNLCLAFVGGNSSAEALGIISNHQFSVENVTDTYITVVNPWNTGDKLNIQFSTLSNLEVKLWALVYGKDLYNQQKILANDGSAVNDSLSDEYIDDILYQVANWNASTDSGISDIVTSGMENSTQTLVASNINGVQYEETFEQYV